MRRVDRLNVYLRALHKGVTGSCIYVLVRLPDEREIRFLVDCGLFQEREFSELNYKMPFDTEKIDFCLVTHNHTDHIGRLPLLTKRGFTGTIYATEDTCKLLPLSLRDSYKILKKDAKRNNKGSLYRESDVDTVFSLLYPCKYEETIRIGENVKVTFFSNGHLLGAAIILVQISYPGYESVNLLFTGDYNNSNMFFDVKPLPKWVLQLPLTVVQESTYGDMDSIQMAKTFKKNVRSRIHRGGTVLALVFSLGRAQEILYELRTMQKEGELRGIPIYFDGRLSIEYTEMYQNDALSIKDSMKDFLPDNLILVNKLTRKAVLEDKETKIILTTSGMGTYGAARLYIPEYLTRPNNLIQFTGYTAEDTLGGKLKNAEIGDIVNIGGLMVEKKADVEYTTEYSAHAKADVIIDFLNQFENLKFVLLNHGELETQEILAERIVREVNPKYVALLGNEKFFKVNSYGFVKTLSTEFI